MVGQVRARGRRGERDDVAEAERGDEVGEGVRVRGARPARPAQHDDAQALAAPRLPPQQLRGRAHEQVGGLERLDAPDEEEDLGVHGQAEARAEAARPGWGRKVSRSTPGGTTTTLAGSAP